MQRLVAGIAAVSIGTGLAAHEVIVDFGSFQLSGGDSVGFEVDVVDPFDSGPVTFAYFTGVFSNSGEDGSLASDLQLTIVAPNGASTVVGGFDHLSDADLLWEFQGQGSEFDGLYTSFLFDPLTPAPLLDGTWSFTFTHDRLGADEHSWSNVQLWLVPQVPGPGGAAILGLAFLATGSRRRS